MEPDPGHQRPHGRRIEVEFVRKAGKDSARGQPSGALTPAMENENMAEVTQKLPQRTKTVEDHDPRGAEKHEAAIRALAERWPKCFAVDEKRRRPLKIGIAEEVRALLPDIDVSAALALYTHSTSYMKALVAGAVRIGLDGERAGTVSAVHEAFARRELAKRETKQPAVPRRPILSLPSLRPKTKS